MCNVKEPVKVRGGGAGAATIMKFCTMEGYAVGFLIGVFVAAVRSILGSDEGVRSFLSVGSFEDAYDCKL